MKSFNRAASPYQLWKPTGFIREMLRAEGLEQKIGPITRLGSLADLVAIGNPGH